MTPVEDGGLESEIRDDGGEIRNRAIREGGLIVKGLAGINTIALKGVAGRDDYWVGHQEARNGTQEFFRRVMLGGPVEVYFPPVLATPHHCYPPFTLLRITGTILQRKSSGPDKNHFGQNREKLSRKLERQTRGGEKSIDGRTMNNISKALKQNITKKKLREGKKKNGCSTTQNKE